MKILVDNRWIAPHGLGRFAKEVISRLPSVEPIGEGAKLLSLIDSLWLSWEINKRRPSVYFSPAFNPPIYSPIPFVFTIGDLIHLHVAEESSRAKRTYYSLLVKPAINRAYRVATFSQYSKEQILAWSGVSPEKIEVVGCGVSSEFTPQGPRFDPGFPYLFYIGNTKPHKNALRLIMALARAKIPSEVKLILRIGEPKDKFVQLAQQLKILDRVVFADLIPDDQLPSYYRGAIALVFPTLYEGFGLPPLEAMASGTPVVTSSTTSLPEVVGDAAILVDPSNVEAIADSIERIVADSELRQALIVRGLEQAKRFTWGDTAARVQHILSKAIAEH